MQVVLTILAALVLSTVFSILILKIFVDKTLSILQGKNNLNAFEKLFLTPVKDWVTSFQDFLSDIFKEIDLAYNKILSVAYDIETTAEKNQQQSNLVLTNSKDIQNSISALLVGLNLVLEHIESAYKNVSSLEEFMTHFKEKNQNIQEDIQKLLAEISIDLGNMVSENTAYTQKMADQITKLKTVFKKVEDFLGTIVKISEQINILALNASIESAKLESVFGENFKTGFHVIADQIRRLSNDTRSTADEIGDFIIEISGIVDGISSLSKKSKDMILTQVEYSKTTFQKLNQVLQLVDYINKKISQASEKLSLQYSIVNDLKAYVSRLEKDYIAVDNSTNRILSSVGVSQKTASRLMRLTNRLVDMCREFESVRNDISAKITKRVEIEVNQQRIAEAIQTIENEVIPQLVSNWQKEINHKEVIDQILQKFSNVFEALWTNNPDGTFIYSNPPEGIENAKVREWFTKAMAGHTYVSSAYISAITKNYCITVSLPVYDDFGKLLGVIGADIKLSM
uniref:Chemotaxis protein n=1 Tax=Caldicellulosiruptor owensensis TaxID=55205 RepID=A0A7C5Z0N0_9FIRM